jgi:peptidoglycan hydrolase CwlO-like protein
VAAGDQQFTRAKELFAPQLERLDRDVEELKKHFNDRQGRVRILEDQILSWKAKISVLSIIVSFAVSMVMYWLLRAH